jgi:hypothetical protein
VVEAHSIGQILSNRPSVDSLNFTLNVVVSVVSYRTLNLWRSRSRRGSIKRHPSIVVLNSEWTRVLAVALGSVLAAAGAKREPQFKAIVRDTY